MMGYRSYFKGEFDSAHTGDIGKSSFVSSPSTYPGIPPTCSAWYPIDEGSGTVIHNRATAIDKLPNLTVSGLTGFWAFPGFGTSGGSSYCYWESDTPCAVVGAGYALSCFCRISSWPGVYTPRIMIGLNNQLGTTDCHSRLNAGLYTPANLVSYGSHFSCVTGISTPYITKADTYLKWVFVYSFRSASVYEIHVVRDDGTQEETLGFGGVLPSFDLKRIRLFWDMAFVGVSCPWVGQIGDVMIYTSTLTPIDWRSIYTTFRDRYNMDAPSGW